MRKVSSQYLQTIQQHRDRGYRNKVTAELFLGLVDDTAKADSTYTYSPEIFYSNFENMYDPDITITESYATWERNSWRVDGTQRFQPTDMNYYTQGYITHDISTGTGAFVRPQFMDFRFSIRHSIVGVTIRFDERFPRPDQVNITVYEGTNIVGEFEYIGDEVYSHDFAPELRIENFDRILIEFRRTNPNQRIHINEVEFGIGYLYLSDAIISLTHTRAGHPLSTEIPKNEIQFTLRNDAGRFTADSGSSVVQFLMIGQKAVLTYGYDLDGTGNFEYFQGGIFYLKSWSASGFNATFNGTSVFERLTETYYDMAVFDNVERTMKDYADNVLASTGLTRYNTSLPVLASTKTKLPLPIITQAACLQLIANATRTILSQDDKEFIYFTPYDGMGVSTGVKLVSKDVIDQPTVTLVPACRDSIVQYTGVFVDAAMETTDISKIVVEPGFRTQVRHNLCTGLNFVAIDSGIAIISQEHYAYVSYVTTAGVSGEVVLRGKQNVYDSYGFVSERLIDNGQDTEMDNPIVNYRSDATEINNNASEYYSGRIQYSLSTLGYPELDFADVLDYNDRRVIVLSNQITMSGGAMRGTLVLRGG